VHKPDISIQSVQGCWKIRTHTATIQYAYIKFTNEGGSIQLATTTFQHKRIQPATLPILSVFQFFS